MPTQCFAIRTAMRATTFCMQSAHQCGAIHGSTATAWESRASTKERPSRDCRRPRTGDMLNISTCADLASHILSRMAARISADWEQSYGG